MAESSSDEVGLQASPTLSQILSQVQVLKQRVDQLEGELATAKSTSNVDEIPTTTDAGNPADDTQSELKNKSGGSDDHDYDVRLFEDSTHSYLIYWEEKRSAGRLVVAYGVLILQLVLYSLLAREAVNMLCRDLMLNLVYDAEFRSCIVLRMQLQVNNIRLCLFIYQFLCKPI